MPLHDESLPGAVPEPTATPSAALETASSDVKAESVQVSSEVLNNAKGDANTALRQTASKVPPEDARSAAVVVGQVENAETAGSARQAGAIVVANGESDAQAALKQAASKVEEKAERAAVAELTPEAKHLQLELQKLVAEMQKEKWIFTRLVQWFQRLQLIMNLTMALLSAVTASFHTHLSSNHSVSVSALNTIVVGAMTLQGVVIGINSYLDFSKVKAEALAVAKGYSTILNKLQPVVAEPEPTANELRTALQEATRSAQQLVQGLGFAPPKWVVRDAEAAMKEAASGQGAAV